MLHLDLSVAGPETNGLILLSSLLLENPVWCARTLTINPPKKQNIVTMDPPIHRLPVRSPYVAQSITIIAIRRCDFINETNKFFILLTYILCEAAQRARGQKVSFWSDCTCIFKWLLHWNYAHWPQLLADILFAATPRVLVVFRHHGAIIAMVLYDRGGLHVIFTCSVYL